MTNMELAVLTCEWQKTLRIQDWEVAAVLLPRKSMHYEDCEGICLHDLEKKTCIIQIREDSDDDLEYTLVHELLHLWVAPFEDAGETSLIRIAQEQMVECLAISFVRLKRGELPQETEVKKGGPGKIGSKGAKPKSLKKPANGSFDKMKAAKTKVKGGMRGGKSC